MGIKLGPLLETRPIKVEELANQKVAIDGYNILYQFCLLYTSDAADDS